MGCSSGFDSTEVDQEGGLVVDARAFNSDRQAFQSSFALLMVVPGIPAKRATCAP